MLLGWHTIFWLIWTAKKNDRVVYAKLTKPTNIVQEIKRVFVSALKKKKRF